MRNVCRERGYLMAGLCLAWSLTLVGPAWAVPVLQLYIEGATYDAATESWTITPAGSSTGKPFRLWAIGNVSGPGSLGSISDVRLSVAFPASEGDLNITLTPTKVGGTGSFVSPDDPSIIITDPSTAPAVTLLQFVTDGSSPILGDGSSSLAPHGIFGPGTYWKEFGLGNFELTDSPIGDFAGAFPASLSPNAGQISAYDISIHKASTEPVLVHFDLYGAVVAGKHSKVTVAPFSHDADGEATIAPEPMSISLALLGASGLAVAGVIGRIRGRQRLV